MKIIQDDVTFNLCFIPIWAIGFVIGFLFQILRCAFYSGRIYAKSDDKG